MKRKGATAGTLRHSPNEEAMLLKEEYERRRKLRLQQVREQQKYIALQIRQKVKQRREEQLHQLEEALKAEWQKAQDEKMKALEELYLSNLRAIGEGHRQAKENEPDLEALAKQAEERRQKAETRHRKALKEQKYQKEKLLREQARRTDARKHALEVERQRAAKVASLPPPPPRPFESFEAKKIPVMKPYSAGNFSLTRYHISGPSGPYVDREVNGEQPDAHLAAEEEGKRLEELHREAERERREQLEKAHLRGSHALKKVHLAKDRERLLEELEQMQSMDRMRRRFAVTQMPPQLLVPAYKRLEIKEEWQRELEFAFEEMYGEDRNVKGDLILHFEPQPLPSPSDRAHDNDLDISLEQESACDTQPESACDIQQESEHVIEEEIPSEPENQEEAKTCQPRSKLALKKLLNKIRSQKEEWTSKCESQSELETIESGTIASEETPLCDLKLNNEQQKNTVCEAQDSVKMLKNIDADENSILTDPQEQAAKIRMEEAAKIRMEEERQKWNEKIEQQKQEQLALLKQIEEEKARLEADFLKIQMQSCLEEAKKKEKEGQGQLIQTHSLPSRDQQNQMEHETGNTTVSETSSLREDSHLQTIHDFQQHLVQQNRLHTQTIEEARKHLQEYQNTLKHRYLSASATPASSMETKSINSSPVSEPVLQRQRVQPAQASEHVNAQEYAWSLPLFSGALHMLEKPSSRKQEEQMHNICPGKPVQFSEASKLKHGEFDLPCDCPSQEQVGTFKTPNKHIGEPSQFQLPSGLVVKDASAVRIQQEARQHHVRFLLPAESSSESSETVPFKESSQKISCHQTETEAGEELPLKTTLMAAAKGSCIVETGSVDSLAFQQGSVESTSKTSPEQPLNLPESTTLAHEESKAQGVEEFLISKLGDSSLLNYSSILNLRDRVLASSESIQAQQRYLKELQEKLDAQREALLSRQKIQEQLLLQKQDKLKEQLQRQQEALKEFLNKQVRHVCPNEEMTEAQKPDWFNRTDFFQVSENCQLENCGRSKFHGSEMISQYIGPAEQTEQSEKVPCREQKWRSSKPPVTKVKLGLGLEQHELSVIPEVDTPRSCSLSFAAQSQDSQVSRDSSVVAAEVGVPARSGPSFRLDNKEVLGSEALVKGIPCDLTSTISTGSFSISETLNASPVGIETERPFPDFHHQQFLPLEPSVDLDTSSSCSQCGISQGSREFSKTSEFSTKSPDMFAFLEVGSSGLDVQSGSVPSCLETNRQNNIPSEESITDNVYPGSEESFHLLPLESTVSDVSQNDDQPVDHNAVLQRSCEQAPGTENRGHENCISPAREYEELSRSMECMSLQHTVEDLRNESPIPLEEQKSFYQVDTTPVTTAETFSQHLIKETLSPEKLPLEASDKYVKLAKKSAPVHEGNNAVELNSQCNINTKEPDQSFPEGQECLRVLRETNLEDSAAHLHSVVQQNSYFLERHEKHSVHKSSCCIPVWETESGRGIMEEPEITLISSNDISFAESDIEHTNQEKMVDKTDNPACEEQSDCNVFTEEREFLPLAPDADYSVFIRPGGSPKAQSTNNSHCPSHQTAVMQLEFAATHGSLQKSFLKRKQNFIQESLKRVEEIKNKEREKPEVRKLQRRKSEELRSRQKEFCLLSGKNGALASQLKKAGKVKLSSPEDRKAEETEMHQRTSRLYNQLEEVKIRKEEKTRQETYAKNREKAKEFQKKMLEKLRAKRSWKAP
ncbi:centrosomal protein of 295 kDa isoform X3 [Pithys albifrons albifrons]|uniref:centrosomal protein of 295 kDa isoform X3 n=1 Tax=Pithys albifrons albifrons TaxID=3385563 RepID=UPI003A5D222E